MNNYGIFSTLGSKVIRLPINPEELPDTLAGANETVNVLGIGEVTLPRTPQQRTVEISGLFPARPESYVLTPNKFMKPEEYIEFFRGAMYDKSVLIYTPVRYMEDGTPFATNDMGFRCTVEGFEVTERGGQTGDFYYKISIKEYRDYTPAIVKIQTATTEDGSADGIVSSDTKSVTQEKTRDVPNTEIVVGSVCEANGNYYYTSYGEEPHGSASGRRCTVVRIVNKARKAPYNVRSVDGGSMGWMAGSALTVVDNNV